MTVNNSALSEAEATLGSHFCSLLDYYFSWNEFQDFFFQQMKAKSVLNDRTNHCNQSTTPVCQISVTLMS
jgi:hypothetical protein